MNGRNKDVIFSFKVTESDESDLDDEDITMISKILKKLFKKGGNYEKKLPPSKENEFGNAMYTAWGTSSDNSNEDDAEDMALMAMEDSELDSESDTKKKSVTRNGKGKNSGDQIICDQDLKRLKDELFSEREKSRRINLDLARTKYELERANKWTQPSMIVTQINNRTHNTKSGIGFVKEVPKKTSYLCTHYGSIGHSRGTYPIVITHMNKNFKATSNRKTNHVKGKNHIKGTDSKCDSLSNVMIEMTSVDDTSTFVPYKIEGESVYGVSKIIEEVLKDVPCEGEYIGDRTIEQSSVVRLNSGASSERESMGNPSIEPSSSIGIHIN
ncbi:hypothetical protein H5410_053133 [Solanum commersonii]|uniref:Uncharacterized protein n=1 Tax=Solanum commersonii TaxID=4109 RepID=A0A9J5X3J0_SOLCO|nr:hypothetical protein H5410_053133 [Solanum commersonii]